MKKFILTMALGWTLHMVYLDLIWIRQLYIISNCSVDEVPDKNGELACLKYGNKTYERFYLKYFGIGYLIPWGTVSTGSWRME